MHTADLSFWIALLSLIAAAQGIFLSIILVGRRQNSVANHILSAAMLLFSFELVTTFYHGSGLDVRFPQLIGATYAFPFLYSPIFFLYAQALTGSFRRTRSKLWHFVPFLLVTAFMVPFYLMSGAEKLLILQNPSASPWSQKLFIVDNLTFVYSLIYLVAILRVIEKHRRRIRDRFSSLDKVNLGWLRILAYGGLGTWFVALGFYVTGFLVKGGNFDPIQGYSDYVSLALAAFVYGIGYMGLRQPEIFRPDLATEEPKEEPTAYARSGVSNDQGREIESRLVELMRVAAPYRDPELTLPQLAEQLDVTPHNLSQVINSRLGVNFYDFVNQYRVEQVKRRIEEDHTSLLTLLSIGLDAGFNSKSSFNAVFKKQVGCTPSEYRRRVGGET
ncbi:MAG: helix-turn-helix domain-containing protein [Rhodothermales bacterium]